MREHRLIEQIIGPLETELSHIAHDNVAHPAFIYSTVDFFRTYANKFHHGKEENILFVELSKKQLSSEHKQIMDELVEEHRYARKTVGELVSSTEKWSNGGRESLSSISNSIRKLCELYPRHINKEDKGFFMPCQQYFTKAEREHLLDTGYTFDKEFTTSTYREKMKYLLDH